MPECLENQVDWWIPLYGGQDSPSHGFERPFVAPNARFCVVCSGFWWKMCDKTRLADTEKPNFACLWRFLSSLISKGVILVARCLDLALSRLAGGFEWNFAKVSNMCFLHAGCRDTCLELCRWSIPRPLMFIDFYLSFRSVCCRWKVVQSPVGR